MKTKQIITPIRRKGCKNAGWIWDENHLNKLVVPLNPNKEFVYITKTYQMKNYYFDKNGHFKKLSFEPNYPKLIKSKKGYKIIEAEHLYKEFRENLRRLATLMILVGIGLMIIGIIKGIC